MIRLLRIQAPGIPLERMPDLLNDFGGDAGELLELDAELCACRKFHPCRSSGM
ncbi:hypothetical protein [Nonomuraea sp. NPDC003201]